MNLGRERGREVGVGGVHGSIVDQNLRGKGGAGGEEGVGKLDLRDHETCALHTVGKAAWRGSSCPLPCSVSRTPVRPVDSNLCYQVVSEEATFAFEEVLRSRSFVVIFLSDQPGVCGEGCDGDGPASRRCFLLETIRRICWNCNCRASRRSIVGRSWWGLDSPNFFSAGKAGPASSCSQFGWN